MKMEFFPEVPLVVIVVVLLLLLQLTTTTLFIHIIYIYIYDPGAPGRRGSPTVIGQP